MTITTHLKWTKAERRPYSPDSPPVAVATASDDIEISAWITCQDGGIRVEITIADYSGKTPLHYTTNNTEQWDGVERFLPRSLWPAECWVGQKGPKVHDCTPDLRALLDEYIAEYLDEDEDEDEPVECTLGELAAITGTTVASWAAGDEVYLWADGTVTGLVSGEAITLHHARSAEEEIIEVVLDRLASK